MSPTTVIKVAFSTTQTKHHPGAFVGVLGPPARPHRAAMSQVVQQIGRAVRGRISNRSVTTEQTSIWGEDLSYPNQEVLPYFEVP